VPKKAWLLLACIWTVTVAVLCLVSFKQLPGAKIPGADKYVHGTFHFVFVILWSQYFRKTSRREPNLFFTALFLSIVFGSLIELAQGYFTTTRQADLKDVLANFTGAALAVIIQLAMRFASKPNSE